MKDVVPAQVGYQFKDVLADLLDFLMNGLIDVIDQHMGLAPIVGEICGHFFADEGVGQMRDGQCALDGVVIGYGDPVHAAGFGDPIELFGFRETLRTADLLENPLGRAGGKARVYV
jgi:hypothetical protein